MNEFPFEFAGVGFVALQYGGLWCPNEALFCASDLHLGKSERIARNGGGLLPPYESLEALSQLEDDLEKFPAKVVIALGDSFDDVLAGHSLDNDLKDRILRLQAGRRWIWITGNHDPAPVDIGGEHKARFSTAGITFLHEFEGRDTPSISGHFHPKARLSLRGRGYSCPCFLIDETCLIMPAYGHYTGGLDSRGSVLSEIMLPDAEAILTGNFMAKIPMPRAEVV